MTRHGCLPSLLQDGDKSIMKKWPVKKKLFCIGQGRSKISCTGITSPTNQPRKDPCQMYSLSPHIIGLQIRYDPRPLSLSIWMHPSLNIKKTLTLDGWASNLSYLYRKIKCLASANWILKKGGDNVLFVWVQLSLLTATTFFLLFVCFLTRRNCVLFFRYKNETSKSDKI